MCVVLGFWQLDRLAERRERNATIESRTDEPARALTSLRIDYHDDPEELAFRRTIAEGQYRDEEEFISVGRVYGDVKGTMVATPLDIGGGDVLIVVRGIVPPATEGPPMEGYPVPLGSVFVEGRITPGEEPSRISEPVPDDGTLTELSRLDLAYIDEYIDGDVLPYLLLLDDQRPSAGGEVPTPIPTEELSEGSHLGYAVQWFAFALIALVGTAALVWRASR